jgi:hypothetical protein
VKLASLLGVGVALLGSGAQASTMWKWSYQGEGVAASGTFTATDAPDADGFYEITSISGEANEVAISGLQRAGTSVPGNDGYPVDNLVRADAPRLTAHGFGYALANGTYANPFYGAHFAKPDYYAFFSDPANGQTSEPSVAFTAAIISP